MFDFSFFPTLETARLRLRRLSHDDADTIIGIFSDAEVQRYLNGSAITTREAAAGFVDWMNSLFEQKTGMRWGITERGQDDVIGTCGFHFWSRENRRADIGYDLIPQYWGRGYMTEAVRMLLGWCFENLDLHRIQADCTAGNIGSERVLEKTGFTLEGIWRESTFEHGRFVDIKQYGLLRREHQPAGLKSV